MNRGIFEAGEAPQPWQAATKTLARNSGGPRKHKVRRRSEVWEDSKAGETPQSKRWREVRQPNDKVGDRVGDKVGQLFWMQFRFALVN